MSSTKGSSAGVDQSGKIVTIHLLDKEFLLHDAFSIFECFMTALAPAYDSMPSTSDDKIKLLLKEMQSDPDSSPMESMTNSIVSKIRVRLSILSRTVLRSLASPSE